MAKRRKAPKGWVNDDVVWYAPYKRKPIAYSTVTARDCIKAMAEDKTIAELKESLLYGVEEKKVLQAYIDKGFGEEKASWLFGKVPMKPKKVEKHLYQCTNCGKKVVTKKPKKRLFSLCTKGCLTYAPFEYLGTVEYLD